MLTAERLREVLTYDPDTGEFRWKVIPRYRSGRIRLGDVAGTVGTNGYRFVKIDGKAYRAHRLVWLHTTGEWPQHSIDHRNGHPDDNRATNLREATAADNQQNQHGPNRNNTSGYLGVTLTKRTGRWLAQICVAGHRHNLGYFATAEEASAAYLAAKRELHPFWHVA